MDEFFQTFRVICNRSEREKKIQEIVILPRQEITLSVLYLTITFIYHVSSSSFQRQERNYIEKVGATYIIFTRSGASGYDRTFFQFLANFAWI